MILTNEYIYAPAFGSLELPCYTIFQEKYGAGEPTDVMAEAILRDIAHLSCKRIIAIGGGTIIDLAKVIAVADTTDIDQLYAHVSELPKKMELIIVPTTCGTGSEMTNIAVLDRTRMGTKMGLVSPSMYADHAVLIPELLYSLPQKVFATSSIDALVHAVESCLSPGSTEYTRLFGYKAIEMILRGYSRLVSDGIEARNALMDDFLTASNFAGIAFSTAGCGTVHAMAYPLGGAYHIPHGESNYAVFIGVLKAYASHKPIGELQHMEGAIAELLGCDANIVYDRLGELLDHILPRRSLASYGIKWEELPVFSHSVMENQQRLLKNSYIPMTEDLILKIYQELYS